MAGMFGVVAAEGEPQAGVIAASARGQRHFPWLRSTQRRGEGLEVLWLLPPPWHERTVNADDNDAALLLDGEVFEDEAGCGAGDPGQLGQWLLQRYRAAGIEGLCGLNGTYNVVVWNRRERRLEIANDLLGLQPLYLWDSGRELYFGSECGPVTGHPEFRPTVNIAGLSDLLTLGYTIGNRTLMTNVTRLDGGSIARWDRRGLRVAKHVTVRYSTASWELPLSVLVEHQHELLKAAFRRRVDSGVATCVPLSGGLDSRTALGFVQRLGGIAEAIHLRPYRTLESDVAEQVAREVGVPIRTVALPQDFLWRYRDESVAVLQGECDLWLSVFSALVFEARDRWPVWISGFMGDAATSLYAYYRGFAPDGGLDSAQGVLPSFADVFEACRNKEGGFSEQELRAVLRPKVASAIADATRATSERLYHSNGDREFQKFQNWKWFERQRFFVGSYLRLFRNCGQPRVPFADRDYLAFAASLPVLALEDKLLYRTHLRRYEPALARIVYSNEGYPVEPSLRVSLRTGLRNAGRRWRRRLGFPPRPDDPWIPVYGCRPPEFAGLLRETREVLCDYFDPGYIDTLIREIPGPSWSHYPSRVAAPPLWDKARKVVTFALWCRAFLMDGGPASDTR